MDFRKNNHVRRPQVDSNTFTKRGHELFQSCFLDNETMTFNKEESDETVDATKFGKYYKLHKDVSGKTFNANSKAIFNNDAQEYAQNKGRFSSNYQDDKSICNIPNFNRSNSQEISDRNYQFADDLYMPCTSRGQKPPMTFHKQAQFQRFDNGKEKTVLANNIYSMECNSQSNCSEKSTYCRPVASYYHQQFVYKTLAKNARLQRLVKQLLLVRQKQKEEDLWNNFINELKNRHKYSLDNKEPSTHILEEITPEIIEDYYDTRLRQRQYDPCQNLLNDFYGVYNNLSRNVHFDPRNENCPLRAKNYPQYVYENQSLCYPTASQGGLMMINKKRQGNQYNLENSSPARFFRGNTIYVDKETPKTRKYQKRKLQPTKSTNTIFFQNSKTSIKSTSMQTDMKCLYPINESVNDTSNAGSTRERYEQAAKNVERLKRKLEKTNSDAKQIALDNIENKLNNLIQTLNTFMVDIRTNNPFNRDSKSLSLSSRVRANDLSDLNEAKSDTFGLANREEAICRVAHENTTATSSFLDCSSTKKSKNQYEKINKILNEELEKSNKVKKDIDDLMYQRTQCPRAVQITFDIPTKERSTEVTQSLSEAKVVENVPMDEIETVKTGTERKMTIAVNTDPLGILGLLRVSSEAVKQILSYMPQIDYYAYLPMLQFPMSRNGIQNFVCNICGASFDRPSQLSDHIQSHNLGYSRDCCVCRHVLDMKKRRPGLFKCKYCGQRFTRAYCCELHEESCAKRLGIQHDVNSSLNLLQ